MALHPRRSAAVAAARHWPHRHQRRELSQDHEHRAESDERRHVLPGQLHRHGRRLCLAGREWGKQKKIFFVHFRDIAGTRDHFRETFHDEGQTDMVKMLKTYHEIGFNGPIRPDHAPTLDEETNDRPGYAIQGRSSQSDT
jgi:hypothetical protein